MSVSSLQHTRLSTMGFMFKTKEKRRDQGYTLHNEIVGGSFRLLFNRKHIQWSKRPFVYAAGSSGGDQFSYCHKLTTWQRGFFFSLAIPKPETLSVPEAQPLYNVAKPLYSVKKLTWLEYVAPVHVCWYFRCESQMFQYGRWVHESHFRRDSQILWT